MKRLLCLLLFTGTICLAQEPTATFRAKTELVLIPVVVERDGQPVTGLKPSDFLVLHQGEPEKIGVFEDIGAGDAPTQRTLPGPQMATNFGVGSMDSDTFIVLLDFLNSSWSSAANMRAYVRDFVKVFADSNTRVAVLLLTPKGLVQAQSFTSDPKNLLKVVDAWSKKQEIDPTRMTQAAPENSFASTYSVTSMDGSSDIFDRLALSPGFRAQASLDKAAMTTRALEQTSQAFGGIPGRKKLAWVSTGFPSVQDLVTAPGAGVLHTEFAIQDQMIRAWHALSTNNIVVYPIDSNGGPTNPAFTNELPNTMSMLEVAARTGGRTCVDMLKDCMKKTLNVDKHYYLLGFYLRGDQKPGWHKLKVELTGPKAQLHARTGFAVEDDKPKPKEVQNEIVMAALASPLDYTGVPLTLHWSEIPPKDNSRQIQVEIASPPGGVVADGSTGTLALDFLAFVRPVGKVDGNSYPASLLAKLAPAQQASLAQNGFAYKKQVPIAAAGNYQLRIFLRDNVSGKIGTVSTIVEVK